MSDINIRLPQLQDIIELLTDIKEVLSEQPQSQKADWMTVNEVCAEFSFSKSFVYDHLQQLQAIQFDGAWRIPRVGLTAFIDLKRQTTREPYRPRRSA